MKKIANSGEALQVELSIAELRIVNNALNEVCNGVDIEDWEFATRLGVERGEAQKLLEEVRDMLRPDLTI